MARNKRAKEKHATELSTEIAVAPASGGSALSIAWACYQRGDTVTARRAVQRVLATGEGDAGEAKKISQLLFAPGTPPSEDPRVVATELLSRLNGPPKPYLFAAVAVTVYLLLVIWAAAHS